MSERASGTGAFFAVALGTTLTLQLPVVLARFGVLAVPVESVIPLAGLGGFGPLVAAIVVARREPGGVRGFFGAIVRERPGLGWALAGLAAAPVLLLVATAVYRLAGGRDAEWLYLPSAPEHFAALALVPIVEELGWRGTALPRLVAAHGPLRATLLLGVAWAAWHLMMFLVVSSSPAEFAVGMANILAGSFLFTWLWLRTRGSVLVAILAHVGAHLDNPARAHPNVVPLALETAALVVFAVLALVLDRERWRAA